MQEKSLGVLGGMGPLATSVFLEKVVKSTQSSMDQDHIDMVILNHASLPDRTEAILENKGGAFLKAIKPDIELLEKANVANIAIPCNTSHYFYEEMQLMTNINIINMVQSTIHHIFEQHGTRCKIAILGTNGTISSGVYQKESEKYGVDVLIPDESSQQKIMNTIYRIKSNTNYNLEELETVIKRLVTKEQCVCVILACTELSCVKLHADIGKFCVDAMDILVRQSILLSGKKMISQN